MFDFLIAGIQAPVFLLVLTGMTVGMVGGFIGVGGGYILRSTPPRSRIWAIFGIAPTT
jgi:hypothetical protein